MFVGLAAPGASRAGAGGWPCQGVYHRPRGSRPKVAVIATHYNVDFSQHYLAEHLAARGYGFLGWNTRFRNDPLHFLLDRALVDIGVGVRWLREEMGVESVIILGNSGGCSLMAAYQSHATTPNVVALPGMRPAPGLDDLVAGDAFIALAAHQGRPDVLTSQLDPSVIDENDPTLVDPELDLWNPDLERPFTAEFLTRYRAAQRDRNARITAWAKAELRRVAAAGQRDRVFTVPRTWADPRFVDPTIDANDRRPDWCYHGEPKQSNGSTWGLVTSCTLRTWLSMWSQETSQCNAGPHLANISVPSFVINGAADTGVFPSDAAALLEGLASMDKSAVEMPGDHYFDKPTDTRSEVADVIAEWIEKRFQR
ncbi:alpha/beta hydrolase [Rhodococcus sp. IEGM 1366]|uniref:alpha/beta hydrolase family protein n=1 Tax=Rhodococcus sp. IEGM 1366 TaxID=3082223 RepID=UPI000E234CED|nr:alpha/beta hydrolase [Rhodococcus sp. IEGM 1366]MDV8068115.1 alpha/beta hydrolase [Rhodococcus sp. IEGM 1366]